MSLCPLCTMGQWGDLHRQHSCGLGPSHPCFVHGAGREVAPRGHTGQDVTCRSHPSSSEGQELPALLLLSPNSAQSLFWEGLKAGAPCQPGCCAPGSVKQSALCQGTDVWPPSTAQTLCHHPPDSLEMQKHGKSPGRATARCQCDSSQSSSVIPATTPRGNLQEEKEKRQPPAMLVKQEVCVPAGKPCVGQELGKASGVPAGISATLSQRQKKHRSLQLTFTSSQHPPQGSGAAHRHSTATQAVPGAEEPRALHLSIPT